MVVFEKAFVTRASPAAAREIDEAAPRVEAR
jgi:hypothetical protein